MRRAAPARGVVFGCNHARKLVEELPHVRREGRGELLERAFHFIAEGRSRERFEKRPAEVQGTELGERQSGGQSFSKARVMKVA